MTEDSMSTSEIPSLTADGSGQESPHAGPFYSDEDFSVESRLHEEQFRLFMEVVPDYAIYMLDPLGRVSTWNAGAERIKGYTASEIVGRNSSCFYPAEEVLSGRPQRLLDLALHQGHCEDEGWRI